MVNRRSFLGWAIAAFATPLTKSKEPKEKKSMVLGCGRCPKCGEWMHLPKLAKLDKYYLKKKVPIICKCRCGYEITEKIWCTVIPTIEGR